MGGNRIRIYRRSEREKNKPAVEERRSREDISIGHELFSDKKKKPPSFPLLSLLTLVWYLLRPQKSTATVAQVPKENLFLSTSFMSLLPLFLYFCLTFQYLSPVFSSAASSSKCLQITQLWNSTLHLYLCLLGQYASCGSRFCSVADGGS